MENHPSPVRRYKAGIIAVVAILVICTIAAIFIIQDYNANQKDKYRNNILELLDSREGEYDTQSIVLYNTSHSEAKQLAERFDAKLRITENGRFATLTLAEGVTIRDIYALDENKDVIEQLSPDFHASITDTDDDESERLPSSPQYTVSDTGYSQQTYLDYMNLGKVWNTTKGSGITVAVIDTGIDTDHPEFAGKISEYSYNATEDKIVKDYLLDDGITYDWSLVEDEQGHGTAVSGVIAASMDGEGIVGVAPEVNILVIKVECDANGVFNRTSDLVFGLYYAIERDVDVVNMSFGGQDFANPYAEATALAVDSDIICVAAAGNDATASIYWPAADENVISVGALSDGSWELAEYSNYGENSDIVAPGTTYTTKNDGTYKSMDGTSFACPNVVGGIALYLSQNRYATFESVKENVYASCYDLGDLGEDWYYGFGAFDINALVFEKRGTVTFNMLTDELDNKELLFVRHHTLQDLPEPERTYAVFDGWYYDIDCTEPLNYYRDEFSADLTLYAKWVNEDNGVPYTYVELDDGTIEIRSYTGKRRYITMPEYIDGKVVSSIGDFAFAGQSRLREVTLPAQLKYIKMSAFSGCNNLVSIAIPDTVTSIGAGAFTDNIRLSSIAFGANTQLREIGSEAFKNCAKITRFDIPAGVTSLDGSVFVGTTSMQQYSIMGGDNASFSAIDGILMNATKTQIIAYPADRTGEYTIPEGIRKIGDYAFAYAKITAVNLDGVASIGNFGFMNARLASVTIPDSVTALGVGTFANDVYLKTATLGSGLTKVPEKAFAACYLLEGIEIPANINTIDQGAFEKTVSLKSLTFAESSTLVVIDAYAFAESGLETVTFPKSLVYIRKEAFTGTALTTAQFADESAIQYIGESAFANNSALSTFELPVGLREIGAYAFQNTALTEVTLPSSLESLGAGAYASCHSLENIFVDDANTTYIDIDGVVYTKDKAEIVAYPAGNARTSYTIDSTTTTISESAFHGSEKLNYVYLPANLVYIERYALTKCTNLLSIDIPDSVYQISNYAFAYDYNLGSINFTENATLPRISYGTFAYTGIYSFRVPACVSTMAQDAFKGCPNLYSITFAANSKLESISAYMFKGCEQLTSITFESGSKLSSIQAHGLEGMLNLTSVNFGDAKITNIDNYAFRYCESLLTLSIPSGVETIGRYAFYGCKALTRLDIPASIDYIGENAFYFADNLDIFFASNSLPQNLAARWDNGIKGYYVGVKNVIENDDWRYAELNGGGISIIEYKGSATDIDLSTIDLGGDVVSIGGYAFYGCDIESIKLPATLKEIHRYAFAFTKLAKIDIPDSVTFIGQYAFLTSDIAEVNFGANIETIEQYTFCNTKNLKTVKLPASLKNLGRYAFSKSALESIDLSACTLTELPEGAFMQTKLTNVTLPDSITLINHNAFRDCELLSKVTFGSSELQLMSNVFYNTGLAELYIPDNLTYIGEYSFVGLEKLTAFTVSTTHPKYQAIDGLLYSKDGRKLIAAPAGRTGEITLPESLEVLGFGAFENSKLTKINFHPNSNILTFGYRCFYNAAITELNVPATVVSFDFYAFAMCKNLTTVTFAEGNNLKGIYEGAFYGCLNLRDIVIPDSIVEISDYAFYGCTSLEELPISETSEIKGIYDYAFAHASFNELTLPGSLIDIGNYAFKGAKMTSVTVPDDNKELLIIGIGAFEECNNLEEITLPFIGASFEDMDITWFGYIFGAGGYEANNTYVPESLKTVTISEGITFVGQGAFYGVENVEQVHIPHSVTGIYNLAFIKTAFKYELTNKIASYSERVYGTEIFGNSYIDGWYSHFGSGISGHLQISDSVKSIGRWAFGNCAFITSVTIPNGIETISEAAFCQCFGLTNVVIPEGVVTIQSNAFSSCYGLTSIIIPSSVTVIETSAFSNCENLFEVINNSSIPMTLGSQDNGSIACYARVLQNSDGSKQFKDDKNFVFIDTPDGFRFSFYNNEYKLLAYLGNEDAVTLPLTIDGNEYTVEGGFYGVDTVALPSGMEKVPNSMFHGCGTIRHIVIPDGVTEIGGSAFYNTNLERIDIPNSVQYIGSYAFINCRELTELNLPNGLSTISYGMLNGCSKLTNINIPTSITRIEGSAFKDCTNLKKLIIPEKTSYIGSGAFAGCKSLDLQIDKNNEYYKMVNGMICDADVTKIICVLDQTTNVLIPNTVQSISGAFKKNTNITSVVFEKETKITQIGSSEFEGCTNLKTIDIPEGITSIGWGAFWGCENLKTIDFPESLEELGSSVFTGCYSLVSVDLPNGITDIEQMFSGCISLQKVSIPNSVTYIGERAFQGCSSLVSIDIPDGVHGVGEYAFFDCGGLTTIALPATMTDIGSGAFLACSNLYEIINNSAMVLDIGSSECGAIAYNARVIVNRDGTKQFKNETIFEFIDTEDGFRFIDNNGQYILLAYMGSDDCVTLPAQLNGQSYTVSSNFAGAPNIIIPKELGVCYYMFRDCDSIKKVIIEEGITNIGVEAFRACDNLEKIVLPDSIISIGVRAFTETKYCNSNDNWHNGSLYIGNHLIAVSKDVAEYQVATNTICIHPNAFDNCYGLKTLEISGNHYEILAPLTNLETLVLTELPTSHNILQYFGLSTSNIPLTLKTVILKDGCDVRSADLFQDIEGVNIYVESDKMNVQWDKDYPGWNNGNRVYYGGEWIEAKFYDADGSLINCEYYTTSQVVRQPYVANIVDGNNIKLFVGWDIDGDGCADAIPVTSASHISAKAVYEDHVLGELVTVEPTCTQDGYTKRACTECGEIIEYKTLGATGHTSAGLIETVAPTCSAEGYERHTCSTCGLEYHTSFTDKLEHTFGEWVVDFAPSCTTAGGKHRNCSVCGAREEEVLSSTFHNYTSVITRQPSCAHEGEAKYTCSKCGSEYTVELEKTQHDYQKVKANKSFIRWLIEHILNIVCGYEGEECFYYRCDDCNSFMTVDEYSVMGGASVDSVACNHVLGEWTAYKPVSCFEDGIDNRSCTKCGEIIEARVALSNADTHLYGEWQSDSSGHWKACTDCNQQTTTEAHVYTDDDDADCNICGRKKHLPGDANNDGMINGKDVTAVRRYNAGYSVDINLDAADVNADNVINGKDVTAIRRYNAGYPVELLP